MLLERVSWCCRDHRRSTDGDGTAELVFSNRASTSYDELREYFALLKRQSDVGGTEIDWSVVDPSSVRSMKHEAMMGLQIADACASAFYSAFQTTPQGFNEPRYAVMLRPVVYAHKGRRFGNGLKVWPREADSVVQHATEMAWLRETYPCSSQRGSR